MKYLIVWYNDNIPVSNSTTTVVLSSTVWDNPELARKGIYDGFKKLEYR